MVNQFNTDAVYSALEAFNGFPDPDSPTGRYGSDFNPLMAVSGGSLSDKDNVVAITNASARKSQCTNIIVNLPNAKTFPWENAASAMLTFAPIAQNTPHKSNANKALPDIPVPADGQIGDFSNYDARDYMVKRGACTVTVAGGSYIIQDFVTTYAPDGDDTPKFRWARDLILDWVVGYNIKEIMKNEIMDKGIAGDNDPIIVEDVITPSLVKQRINSLWDSLSALNIITDAAFSKAETTVELNNTNPKRLDITSKYKRSGVAHIVSTDLAVDFAYTI